MMNKIRLKYPKSWNEELANKVGNGCGPDGAKWKSWIVPDKIFFVSVKEACRIHDFMYYKGRRKRDQVVADNVFLQNMNKIFDMQPWWSIVWNPLRRKQAKLYHIALVYFGESAFMAEKDGVNDTVEPTPDQLKNPALKPFAKKFIAFKEVQERTRKKNEVLKLAAMKKFNKKNVA